MGQEDIKRGFSFISGITEEEIRREKDRARILRKSQWWKNKRGQGVCYYCKGGFRASELTMDHIVPIIRGGKSTKGNIAPCCKECNNKKRYMIPSEWEEYLKSLA